MKKYILFLILLITLIGCNSVYDEKLTAQNNEKEITAEGITLKWEIVNDLLNVTLIAPTTGWISVGFDPTQQMLDANIIIGYVDQTGVYVRDDFGDSAYSHASDISSGGTDNITNITGSEEEGVTEINFSIPLDSGDTFDRVLTQGNVYPVILAYGSNDDFDSIHTVRTSVVIEL